MKGNSVANWYSCNKSQIRIELIDFRLSINKDLLDWSKSTFCCTVIEYTNKYFSSTVERFEFVVYEHSDAFITSCMVLNHDANSMLSLIALENEYLVYTQSRESRILMLKVNFFFWFLQISGLVWIQKGFSDLNPERSAVSYLGSKMTETRDFPVTCRFLRAKQCHIQFVHVNYVQVW